MLKAKFIVRSGMADIWDLGDGTILKAFRQSPRSHRLCINDMSDHNLLTRFICDQEIKAYKLLSKNIELSKYIPIFYKEYDPSVLDTKDVKYVQGAGFILEKLDGKDCKINELEIEKRNAINPILCEIDTVLSELNLSIQDASCFYISSELFKIIDFAYWDYSDYSCALYDSDHLNKELRNKLLVSEHG
jgi:hypothetical protein